MKCRDLLPLKGGDCNGKRIESLLPLEGPAYRSQGLSSFFKDLKLRPLKVFKVNLGDWGGGVEKPSAGYR